MRIQMIIGLVVGLVLVAVPLYLWRRPEAAPVAEQSDAGAVDSAAPFIPSVDGGAGFAPRVKLTPFKTIRCRDPGPGKTPPQRCDHIRYFEDSLAKAVRENTLCAPETKTGASVSFVMDLDFRRKERKIYRGKSSTISANRTKELFSCVERALPKPDWASIRHQHAHYVVNLKATYPPSEGFE